MRYFKIPLYRISTEKSETIQEQTVYESKTLGKKLGYDRCPYLSFFVRRFEDEIFNIM